MAYPVWRKLRLTLDMIKFEHSVFALPFALTGALLALREQEFQTPDLWVKLMGILLCMISARSSAMTFNRLLDAAIDARNPRTSGRHLPAGLLSKSFAWLFWAACIVIFLAAAALLNPLCLQLAPLALAIIHFYSWTKRFTSLSHIVLGFALGIAPAAAWIAVSGALDPRILWLTAAVMCWTAGFDIIYSCQDYEFDRREGLHSLPARLGIAQSLAVARLLHGAMLICLLALVNSFQLGWLSLVGISAVALLLLWEHRLVRASDLSRVDAAFFTVNGYVSILFLAFWSADIFLLRGGV